MLHPHTFEIYEPYDHLREFLLSLPQRFSRGEGECIYKGRNELRVFTVNGTRLVVKSFGRPHFINQLVYGFLRPSKARRSCEHAHLLASLGIGSPAPVGYINVRTAGGLLFDRSFLVTLESTCPVVYRDLLTQHIPWCLDAVREVARTAARLHDNGLLHKDFSRGNILLDQRPDGTIRLELIDLNRMRRGPVSLQAGCHNLERLPVTPEMQEVLATTYAAARHFEPQECLRLLRCFRSQQHDHMAEECASAASSRGGEA